jgi:predicted nucleic acid-binding protein
VNDTTSSWRRHTAETTSALYALLDRSDANAKPGLRIWDRLMVDSAPLVTTNYVVLEAVALLQARLGVDAVTALRALVEPFISIHYVDSALHFAALEQLVSIARRGVSLVDLPALPSCDSTV